MDWRISHYYYHGEVGRVYKSWRKGGHFLSIVPWDSRDYWEKKFLYGPRKEYRKYKEHDLQHHATCLELGDKIYMQIFSDQENIYTKKDINKCSSEV